MQIDDTPKIADGVWGDGGWVEAGRADHGRRRGAGLSGAKLSDVPAGDYTVQAVLNVYETFHRADGKTIKLAPDRGEGQALESRAGESVYQAAEGSCGHRARSRSRFRSIEVIPPIVPEPDTKYVRHIRIQSALLTKFWGTPMYL